MSQKDRSHHQQSSFAKLKYDKLSLMLSFILFQFSMEASRAGKSVSSSSWTRGGALRGFRLAIGDKMCHFNRFFFANMIYDTVIFLSVISFFVNLEMKLPRAYYALSTWSEWENNFPSNGGRWGRNGEKWFLFCIIVWCVTMKDVI